MGCISNWQCPRFWSQGERWDGGYGEVALRLVCSGTCLFLFFLFCSADGVQQPLLSNQKSHELLVKYS